MAHPRPGDTRDHSAPNWWRVSLRAKGVAVLFVPIAALFAALFAVYWVEGDVREADQAVVHFYGTRDAIGVLRSSLLDSETAVSGYSATGEQRFLDVYERARKVLAATVDQVAAHTDADRQAMVSLAEIKRGNVEELRLLDQIRDLGPGSSAAPTLIEREKASMADLQARVSLLNEYEERLFTDARYQRDVARRRLFRTVILCGILGPLGGALHPSGRRRPHGAPLAGGGGECPPPGPRPAARAAASRDRRNRRPRQPVGDAAYLLREREREVER